MTQHYVVGGRFRWNVLHNVLLNPGRRLINSCQILAETYRHYAICVRILLVICVVKASAKADNVSSNSFWFKVIYISSERTSIYAFFNHYVICYDFVSPGNIFEHLMSTRAMEFVEILNDLYLNQISVLLPLRKFETKAISMDLYRKHTNPLFIYDAMVNESFDWQMLVTCLNHGLPLRCASVRITLM